jgi:SEC-C motif-containing protein
MTACHCGSGEPFAKCCAPYITGAAVAPTAEALMRSRYSAYVEHAIDYLGETLHPAHRTDWDREATRRWAEQAVWQGLEILSTERGEAGDDIGFVEFIAHYREDGVERHHRERSRFGAQSGRWYYIDGTTPKPKTERHEGPRVGRNDPCPCGSGRKYKKCCGA